MDARRSGYWTVLICSFHQYPTKPGEQSSSIPVHKEKGKPFYDHKLENIHTAAIAGLPSSELDKCHKYVIIISWQE
jgi:hypothetical protein